MSKCRLLKILPRVLSVNDSPIDSGLYSQATLYLFQPDQYLIGLYLHKTQLEMCIETSPISLKAPVKTAAGDIWILSSFCISQNNNACHFMIIFCLALADNSHEMPSLIFLK